MTENAMTENAMTENVMTETADYDSDDSTPDRPGPARATEDYDDDPPGRQASDGDEAEDRDRDDERPGRREARYRRERNEARARVAELEQRVEGLLAREVARVAGDTLDDRWGLVLFHPDFTELLDEKGMLDPEKVAERAQQLVEWKPGLAKGARVPIGSFGQGRRMAVDQGTGVTWGAVLRGHD